jgi:hypothetical protein
MHTDRTGIMFALNNRDGKEREPITVFGIADKRACLPLLEESLMQVTPSRRSWGLTLPWVEWLFDICMTFSSSDKPAHESEPHPMLLQSLG